MEPESKNVHQLMDKEVIKFEPKLREEAHYQEYLFFCKKLYEEQKNKTAEERTDIFVRVKEEVLKKYGVKANGHTELAFVLSLLMDLLLQDWELIIEGQYIRLEILPSSGGNQDIARLKENTRRRHLFARDSQLREKSVADFLKNMERTRLTTAPGSWHSIASLMRDGSELKSALDRVNLIQSEEHRLDALRSVVKPYIQFAEPGERCEHTGLYLSEIWRYFRHTWINEYKSLPGRSISILIRDAATPNHPVIGIAALGSSVAQQSCRDEWIGWDGNTFIRQLQANPDKKHRDWIIATLDALINEVYREDFLKENILKYSEIINPTQEKIKELKTLSADYRKRHTDNPHSAKFVADNEQMSWRQRAETFLFKSKRALLLSDLLSIKFVLNKYSFGQKDGTPLKDCLEQPDFHEVVKKLIRKAKAVHVGIDMMDIIVCGAIAPYNHLLGGKLVCMLLASPEVVNFYNKKYEQSISLIASSMGGKPITRKPNLVLLGTTSLYGAGSSQYNRIKIPGNEIGGDETSKIEYKELGYSEGFGSFHFSASTLKLADAIAGQQSGRARVNSIFGEGANPLMRKIRDALEYVKLDSTLILNHRNKRIIYGVALAKNFGEVLTGLEDKPKYIIRTSTAKKRSDLIADFWIRRWLNNRAKKEEVLEQVRQHAKSHPMTHGAMVKTVGKVHDESLLF